MNLPFANPAGGRGVPGAGYDVRPMVADRNKDHSIWWFAGGLAIAAVLLFSAMEARRLGNERQQRSDVSAIAAQEAIPDLDIPPFPVEGSQPVTFGTLPQPGDVQRGVANLASPRQVAPAVQPIYPPESYPDTSYFQPTPPAPPMTSGQPVGAKPESAAQASPARSSADRITAGRLENPATTVVQGTLINAVLETALDSTRPGQTRAIVTRDVFGFDGKRLLIPRGTRLYGIYEADLSLGQDRAQIHWTRLLRPDGVSVALDSPAADPLGRAGVEGRVNTHFFQRLGNALVGTTASVGSALVTRNIATSPVVVAVPAGQQAVQSVAPSAANEIRPTLTVRQGTRVAVFVQHDLDFSSVEEAR